MALGELGVYFFLFLAVYFEVFLLISFFEKRPPQKNSARPKRYPSVSIIVPCWNEEKTLAATVNSLLALEYPKEKLSVVIVNDGSTDDTLGEANRFANNPQVRIFSKENGGKYTALNLGIANSQSDLVGCLDADSFVEKDALLEVVKKFDENPSTMAVVPAMKVANPHNLLELMQAVEYTLGIFFKKIFDNLSAISVLPGPFSVYRREIFSAIGPFRHAHNTEDMEMAFRMQAHKLPIENAHTAVVYTKVPQTLGGLLKQRTRWSQGFLLNSRDYRHMYFNPLFGNFGLLVLPFGLVMFVGAIYMFSYILFHLASSLTEHFLSLWSAQIPLHVPVVRFDWFYFNTSMMMFLIAVTLSMTLAAVLFGRRMAGADFGIGSLVSYFTIYGFVAPLWLARAAWGAVRSKESAWR